MAERDDDAIDIQVAGSLAVAGLLSDEGLQALQGVLQGAADPVAAVANAIFMALSKVREKLDSQGLSINDKLWVAKGGVLDRVLFEVCATLKAVLGFEDAASPQFAGALKQGVMDLMRQEESGGNPAEADAQMMGQPAPPPQQGGMGTGLMGGM